MKAFEGVLSREMDRKEFLMYAGLLILTISGLAGLSKSVLNIFNPKTEQGFGANPYGK